MFDFEDKSRKYHTGYANSNLASVKAFNKMVKTYNITKQDVNNTTIDVYSGSEDSSVCKNFLRDIGVNMKIAEVTLCDLSQCIDIHRDAANANRWKRKAIIYVIDCKYALDIGWDSCEFPKLIYNNTSISLHKYKLIEFDITKYHGLMTNSRVKLAVFFFNGK